MNIIENTHKDKDIIISLPKEKMWLEYLSYIMDNKSMGKSFDVIVEQVPKTVPGKRCYIVFDGFIKWWMVISKLRETIDNDICIELSPSLELLNYQIQMEEFEGFRYYYDNSKEQ